MKTKSLVGDQPFFPDDTFPWAVTLEKNWLDIRAELDELLTRRNDLPNFQDISVEQSFLTQDNQWKTYFFAGFGVNFDSNRARCPRTAALLDQVDGLQTAFFSILGPGKRLPEHRGVYKGVIRYHLGLKIPSPETACGITVGGQTAHWREGASMVFDDTYQHSAWNETDEDRVVLFLDIVRPLKFPYSLLNRLALAVISRSQFVKGAQDRNAAWEKAFEAAGRRKTA
ncbi:aspartyl/asparaginyl beta-hydroxylase domain-containing protein [Streptomyces sp. WAC04114]|uniref:aspartyl/asparaginyl beta-hydroxylase domain-containing protein n=1 Tax=Streptomyces sp. WAC04114 TaxID=2867961 RepID=UPI001C8B0C75|nr:aspartyl/asparaginyl beta-hydroxylase domain-containing protein [Streptomyces sp. WAC04114]MBX9363700.1 aspartyl/asparaginyl beta-hydroxylase domain-containing protein [Streptomyces sp. WAC04114]